MCPSAASLSDWLGAEDISSWPGVRTHDMLQRSMATESLGRLGAVVPAPAVSQEQEICYSAQWRPRYSMCREMLI